LDRGITVPDRIRRCEVREEALRLLKLTVASLLAALMLSTPALAQGADPDTPADSQYDVDSEALSTGDIPKTLADNAADGTGAVNDALEGSGSSGSSGGSDDAPEKVAGLTVLPETGGASLAGACAGVLVSGAGLLLLVRRTDR
jgi:hypothetical protein